MPPEWEKQEAIWLSWPCHPESWPDRSERIERQFVELMAIISRHAEVRLNASPGCRPRILDRLKEAGVDEARVRLHDHPNNDAWCRDHGPIFVRRPDSGELAVINWEFNG